ncbi:MAG: Gx transporter family protein, partial [Spirochaetales bacterium]|nr:Gx transporter family protein [Spirochaetales bacterium]
MPKPVPFFRLGLANLPIMLSFLCMTKKESTALIFLKVLLQGIISGTLFSYIFLFSLAG